MQCSISDCNGVSVARTWCSKHYGKWNRTGDPLFTHQYINAGVCSVTSCDNKAHAITFCRRHYEAKKRGHDPHTYTPYSIPIEYHVRECYIVGDECHIPLSDGTIARVDKEDFDLVSDWNWCAVQVTANNVWYVVTNRPNGGRDSKGRPTYDTLYLHRHIMAQYGSIDNLQIDHKDHVGRNNLKENLRAVPRYVNSLNSLGLCAKNTSGYKGVHRSKQTNRWIASVRLKTGKVRHIMQTTDKKEAARRRDIEILREHSDTLLPTALNFPEDYAEYQTIISGTKA